MFFRGSELAASIRASFQSLLLFDFQTSSGAGSARLSWLWDLYLAPLKAAGFEGAMYLWPCSTPRNAACTAQPPVLGFGPGTGRLASVRVWLRQILVTAFPAESDLLACGADLRATWTYWNAATLP